MRYDVSLLTDQDLHLFNEGSHTRLYEKLGAHYLESGSDAGTCFAVWAPNAEGVSVMGDFNGWDSGVHPLRPRGNSGIWEGFLPGVGAGSAYKYHVISRYGGYRYDKSDPFAFFSQAPPRAREHRVEPPERMGRCRVDGRPAPAERRGPPHLHLRGAPRLLDAGSRRRGTAR